jgi:[CysO sulfur-carrier protein]-S-L-cysteine hydrolase
MTRVEIPASVKSRLRQALRRAGQIEIGGVLMGEQIEPGRFRVVDISIDEQTGGRAHFVRGQEAHSKALDEFFQRTGNEYARFNYLGEWHSHPSFSVSPSATDRHAMCSLVHGERGIDFAVLLIVRLYWRCVLRLSCTLFQRGIDERSVEISEATAC